MNSSLINNLKIFWQELSPDLSPKIFFCPGRVNLIGEHIDYNGGFVFPIAISRGIYCLYAELPGDKVQLHSIDYPNDNKWQKYVLGCLEILKEENISVKGGRYLFGGDLPVGAGVSSSAALEVVTMYVNLFSIQGDEVDREKLALMAQRAEREKVGVMCGIMDQFCVANAKKDKALLLNCSTLENRLIPFELKENVLVVMNTAKPRALVESKYNQRREECKAALSILNKKHDFKDLCSADLETVNAELKNEEILLKRARHVVTEQRRVLLAADALSDGKLEEFAQLMTESHISLKNDYEVSGKELDTIVELALLSPYCIGARMTGAGFGGCAIAIIRKGKEKEFEDSISDKYFSQTGYKASFIYCGAEEGVSAL
jgi:galactokinase